LDEGFGVGCAKGFSVFLTDGFRLGFAIGLSVFLAEGFELGFAIGLSVFLAEGLAVGFAVVIGSIMGCLVADRSCGRCDRNNDDCGLCAIIFGVIKPR
jgi:hypothetical protein